MNLYTNDEYRATKDWPYALCAGTVLYRHGQDGIEVLLLFTESPATDNNPLFEYPNTYHLPKGHLDQGELPTDGALRETLEETGCHAKIKTYLGALTWDFVHPKTTFYTIKTTLYFAAEVETEVDEIDNEHDGKVWVSVDEAKKLLGAPN